MTGLRERTEGASSQIEHVLRCRSVLGRVARSPEVASAASRRQNVGNLADPEGIGPSGPTAYRHMQANLVPPAGIEPATPGIGNTRRA